MNCFKQSKMCKQHNVAYRCFVSIIVLLIHPIKGIKYKIEANVRLRQKCIYKIYYPKQQWSRSWNVQIGSKKSLSRYRAMPVKQIKNAGEFEELLRSNGTVREILQFWTIFAHYTNIPIGYCRILGNIEWALQNDCSNFWTPLHHNSLSLFRSCLLCWSTWGCSNTINYINANFHLI